MRSWITICYSQCLHQSHLELDSFLCKFPQSEGFENSLHPNTSEVIIDSSEDRSLEAQLQILPFCSSIHLSSSLKTKRTQIKDLRPLIQIEPSSKAMLVFESIWLLLYRVSQIKSMRNWFTKKKKVVENKGEAKWSTLLLIFPYVFGYITHSIREREYSRWCLTLVAWLCLCARHTLTYIKVILTTCAINTLYMF